VSHIYPKSGVPAQRRSWKSGLGEQSLDDTRRVSSSTANGARFAHRATPVAAHRKGLEATSTLPDQGYSTESLDAR
jgi:hypothetical protein